MKKIALVVLLGLTAFPIRAEDITTSDGTTYTAVTIVSHDDNGISIWHKGGQATIPYDNLSAALQKQYGYKPKPIDWSTDYAAAVEQAKVDKKLLLLDFTGSDWCGYCMLLEKEVFPTPAFRAFARPNFVCVTLDFPHEKTQSAEEKRQNQKLQKKFGITGYPSLIIVTPEGKELGRYVGYDPGKGPDYVIGKLKPFLEKK